MEPNELELVPFKGGVIEALMHEGQPYVVVKRTCEDLGIDHDSQRKKLSSLAWAVAVMITATGPDGKRYEMFCVSLDTMLLWLAGINPNKVAAAARPALIAYQMECSKALRAHFFAPRTELVALHTALAQQTEGSARAWRRVGDLERQVAQITAGPLRPEQATWAKARMREIGELRWRVNDRLQPDQVYGRVQSDVRDFFRFTLAWDEFPCARLEELRLQLRRMHRRALKEAREVGFAGSDTWTQPPLPPCGVDEEEEDTEAVVPAGGAS